MTPQYPCRSHLTPPSPDPIPHLTPHNPIGRVDVLSLPLAMSALLLFLTFGRQCPSLSQLPAALGTSLRLLLVPLVCIPVAVVVALAILKSAAALRMPVSFVTPALVCCTVVAISIDYSLFLLAAFAGARQQVSAGAYRFPHPSTAEPPYPPILGPPVALSAGHFRSRSSYPPFFLKTHYAAAASMGLRLAPCACAALTPSAFASLSPRASAPTALCTSQCETLATPSSCRAWCWPLPFWPRPSSRSIGCRRWLPALAPPCSAQCWSTSRWRPLSS